MHTHTHSHTHTHVRMTMWMHVNSGSRHGSRRSSHRGARSASGGASGVNSGRSPDEHRGRSPERLDHERSLHRSHRSERSLHRAHTDIGIPSSRSGGRTNGYTNDSRSPLQFDVDRLPDVPVVPSKSKLV